jgi:hypothetical protein
MSNSTPPDDLYEYISPGAIVGMSLGSVAALALAVALGVFCCIKRRRAYVLLHAGSDGLLPSKMSTDRRCTPCRPPIRRRRSAMVSTAVLEEGNLNSQDLSTTANSNPFATLAAAPLANAQGYFPGSDRPDLSAATLRLHGAAAPNPDLPVKIAMDAAGSDTPEHAPLPPLPVAIDADPATETASLPPAYDQRWQGIRSM